MSNCDSTSMSVHLALKNRVFLEKSYVKVCRFQKKRYLCNVKNEIRLLAKDIGIWCNGNTTDSGPVIPGSNPGIPTNRLLIKDKAPLKLKF